jgi:hypothetical protein
VTEPPLGGGWSDGGLAWVWASLEAKGVGWAREMVVGGHCRSCKSVFVVWGISGAKGDHLRSVAVRGRGRRQCVRWQQWLKVAEADGVGPIGGGRSVGRRGRRKIFWGEKISPIRF